MRCFQVIKTKMKCSGELLHRSPGREIKIMGTIWDPSPFYLNLFREKLLDDTVYLPRQREKSAGGCSSVPFARQQHGYYTNGARSLCSQSPGGLREERAMVHFPHNQWFDRIAVVSAAGTLTCNLPHLTAVR